MARGGPRADNRGGAPDWLGKRGESEMQQMQEPRQERRRRRGRDDDDDGDDDPKAKKGGIKFGPLVFLVLMIMPAALPMLLDVMGKLEAMGVVRFPNVSRMMYPNKYRVCLEEYYADWAPEKLGGIDAALTKYEGKEKQLFGTLQRKYGKKVNLAKCSSKD